jgi:hypothetical protein
MMRWPRTTRSPCCSYSPRARVWGEHGRVSFLDLQEQWVVVAVTHQQDHERLGPDRADADDLAGDVDVVVMVEHETPLG